MKRKYVRQTGNTLGFNRHFPTALQSITINKQFTYPMGRADQTEVAIDREYANAKEAYAAECERASNSNADSFNDAKIEALARKLLKARGYSEGAVENFSVSEERLAYLKAVRDEDEPTNPAHKAEQIVNNISGLPISFDDINTKAQFGETLSIPERIAAAQWSMLQESPERRQRKKKLQSAKLYDLWNVYGLYRGDSIPPAFKSIRWNLFIKIVGNPSTNATVQGHQELNRKLNVGLETYKNLRLAEVKGATVRRELNDIKAALTHSSEINSWTWIFSKTKISRKQAGTVAVRIPLSLEHQKLLVAYCTSAKHCNEPCSTMGLLYLTGIMFSEVERMDLATAQLSLNHPSTPYVVVDGITKTSNRKRVVPITVGHAVVAAGIANTLEWFRLVSQSKRERQMKAMLANATGCNDYSAHCLRHSFALNCSINPNVRDMDKINIGGWSAGSGGGGNTKISMDYGAASIEGEGLTNLYRASLEIHKHLL